MSDTSTQPVLPEIKPTINKTILTTGNRKFSLKALGPFVIIHFSSCIEH